MVGSNLTTGVRTVGKLTLCDLAGSERINKTGATGAPRSHPCKTPYTLISNIYWSFASSASWCAASGKSLFWTR